MARHTKLVQTQNEHRLVHLEAQDLRLDERERLAVDLDQALAGLAVRDSGRGLLLAEALDGLRRGCHVRGVVVSRREGGKAFVVGVKSEVPLKWFL